MKSPTDLFQLIKSMTKSEKRYFKVYASKHANRPSNCVRLFDAIESQKEYDEEAIRKQFRNERFIRQLPVQKNYLYDLVLKTLRSFHSGRTVEIRLEESMHEVEVLYNKGLYSQCSEILSRTRPPAYQHELFDQLLAILGWETRLAYATGAVERLHSLADEREQILEMSHNLNLFFKISLQLLEIERTNGWLRDERSRQAIQEIAGNPLMASEERALSFKAKTTFYNSWTVIHALLGDHEGAYRSAIDYLQLLESRPEYVSDNSRSYISALSNAISACFRLRKFDEMRGYMKTLESVPTDSEEVKARIQSMIFHHTLNTYVSSGDFVEGRAHVRTIIPALEESAAYLNDDSRMALYYLMAYLCFGAGDHAMALELLGIILNGPGSAARQDIQKASKILVLLIHFELGNHEIIPYAARSAYRFMHSREQMQEVERCVLGLLRRLSSVSSSRDVLKLFTQTRERLARLSMHQPEQGVLKYIDIGSWLQSKIEKTTFASVVRAKSGIAHESVGVRPAPGTSTIS